LGHAYRAVAPFAPEPPFRIYAGEDHAPFEVKETTHLTGAAGDTQLTILTPAKVRPVLVVTKPSQRYEEVLALRLLRLSKLRDDEQTLVRDGTTKDLFHLRPESFPGLGEENAAIITTALRLPISALDMTKDLGELNENELRVVHERLVRAHGLDLRQLILEKARHLVRALKSS
jgi:hypothetical protein